MRPLEVQMRAYLIEFYGCVCVYALLVDTGCSQTPSAYNFVSEMTDAREPNCYHRIEKT